MTAIFMFSFERKQKEELQVRFFNVDEREVQRCRSMERKPAGWEHTCLLATLVFTTDYLVLFLL